MDDLISREAALDALGERPLTWTGGDYELGCRNQYDMDKLAIETVPPAQQWIPCSERLPDELAEVNITWVNIDPEPYYDFIKGKPFTGTAVYFKGKWFWYSSVCKDYLAEYGFSPNDEMDDAIKVIAWCELPEPYKEDEQNG